MKRPAAQLATLILSLTVGSAYLAQSRSAAAAEGKCTIAIKGDSPTAKACAKGGRKEAKAVMKDMVTAANKGKDTRVFSCEKCHRDLDSYELTSSAVADYKKLQAASGIK
jgi:hypothetical protein